MIHIHYAGLWRPSTAPACAAILCALQVFKFCTYLSIPICMTVVISQSPKNLETLIKHVRCHCPSAVAPPRPAAVPASLVAAGPAKQPPSTRRVRKRRRVRLQRDYVQYPDKAAESATADELYDRVNQERARRSASR